MISEFIEMFEKMVLLKLGMSILYKKRLKSYQTAHYI
ncbi:hypothetical protein SAMN05428949_2785 [Chitinophaga sp. YR627]|nr:hypothetical protein SAMN05428949_2785 [Chitinophaga sp. YR627]